LGEDGQAGGADAGLGADALSGEEVGVLPGAGIAVALGRVEAGGELDAVAAVQRRCGGVADQGEADAAGDGEHAGAVGGDVFDGVEGEVEGEDGWAFGLLPGEVVGVLVGIGGGGGGRSRGELADADDVALEAASEAVGVVLEEGLRGWGGLDLGGPEADDGPEGE
jgi:hypothetical protein